MGRDAGGWRVMGLRVRRLVGVAAVTAGLAATAAVVYLWLLWLPDADPAVITWPEGLALLIAPSTVALGLRRAPTADQVAAFVVCLLASAALVWIGGVLLFIAGSR